MRWKISHDGHDPRQLDLLAVVTLLFVTFAAYAYLEYDTMPPPTTATLIEPSQNVHW